MINYSIMLMNYATYNRFENWLALNFHIICSTDDFVIDLADEEPITGSFSVPKEIHEEFLQAFEEIKAEFRMRLQTPKRTHTS